MEGMELIKKIGLIAVILIIWSYGMMTLSNNVDQKVSQYVNQAQTEINDISNRLNQNLEALERDFRVLYNNADIHQYLNEVDKYEDIKTHDLYETVQETLKTMAEKPSYIFAWIANDRADFFLDQSYLSEKGYTVNSRPWYKESLEQDDMFYGDVYTDIGTGQPIVTLMQSYKDVPYGFVSIDYGFEEFFETVSETNGLFMVDRENQIVMSNNKTLRVGTSLLDYDYPLDDILAYDDASIFKDNSLTLMQSNQRLGWKLFYQLDLKVEVDALEKEKLNYQIALSGLCFVVIGLILISKRRKKNNTSMEDLGDY